MRSYPIFVILWYIVSHRKFFPSQYDDSFSVVPGQWPYGTCLRAEERSFLGIQSRFGSYSKEPPFPGRSNTAPLLPSPTSVPTGMEIVPPYHPTSNPILMDDPILESSSSSLNKGKGKIGPVLALLDRPRGRPCKNIDAANSLKPQSLDFKLKKVPRISELYKAASGALIKGYYLTANPADPAVQHRQSL